MRIFEWRPAGTGLVLWPITEAELERMVAACTILDGRPESVTAREQGTYGRWRTERIIWPATQPEPLSAEARKTLDGILTATKPRR